MRMGKFVEDTPTEPDHYMITNQGRRHTKHQLTMSVQGQTSPIRGNFGQRETRAWTGALIGIVVIA